MNYYFDALKKYAVFSGRARRKEYWMFVLINSIAGFAALALDSLISILSGSVSMSPFLIVYGLVVFIPGLSLCVRRLHDVGKRGLFILISLIPFIGAIVMLVYLCREGDVGVNAFGQDPKLLNDESSQRNEPCLDKPPETYTSSGFFNVPSFIENVGKRTIHTTIMIGVELLAFIFLFFIVLKLDLMQGDNIITIFFMPRNLANLMQIFLPLAITSIGAVIVFSRGGFDFSIGGVMGLTSIIAASLMTSGFAVAISVAIFVALVVGLFNMLAIGISKVSGIIITTATAVLTRYIGYGISGSQSIQIEPFGVIQSIRIFSWIVLIVVSAVTVYLIQFPGKGLKGSVVKDQNDKMSMACVWSIGWPYLLSSFLAGIAGLFVLVRLHAATPTLGSGYDIQALFAVALSGSFMGARYGNVLGALLGALFIAVLMNVLALCSIGLDTAMICIGAGIVFWFILNSVISIFMNPMRSIK